MSHPLYSTPPPGEPYPGILEAPTDDMTSAVVSVRAAEPIPTMARPNRSYAVGGVNLAGTTPVLLLSDNPARARFRIDNPSASAIYIGPTSQEASATAGYRIAPGTTVDGLTFRGAVWVASTGAVTDRVSVLAEYLDG